MHRKVVKTYDRKNKGKFDSSTIQGPASTKSKAIKKIKEKEVFNDTLDDPFDTTFDRIYKEFKKQPSAPPVAELSHNDSIKENSESSFQDESSIYKSKKKPRPEKSHNDSIKQNSESNFHDESSIYTPKKKSRQEKSHNDSITQDLEFNFHDESSIYKPKRKSRQEKSHNDSITQDSESNFHDESSIYKPKKKPRQEKIKLLAKRKQLIEDDSLSFIKSSSLLNENSVNLISKLKKCSIPLEPCDWIPKKEELKIKPCSIKISRLTVPDVIKEDSEKKISSTTKRKCEENSDRKVKKSRIEESFNKSPQTSREKSIKILESTKKFDSFLSDLQTEKKDNKQLRKVASAGEIIKSPLILKNCSVSLTRLNSPSVSFRNLISSTPVVKKKGSLPMTLEISNIPSPINESNKIPHQSVESIITSNQFKAPSTRLELSKSRNNCTENYQENTETWNNSSDYSSIDWETISYSESQLAKEPSLQRKFRSLPLEDKKSNFTKSRSSLSESSAKNNSSSINDSSLKSESKNKSLQISLQPCHVGTRRFLNKSPEFEKSSSLFDDSKFNSKTLNEINSSSFALSNSNNNLSNFSKLSVNLTKLEYPESITNSSILEQSDLKGFEQKLELKKLSPMTSIPTSIVYSIVAEDSKNNSSFNDKSLDEKTSKSITLENSNLRKCLDYDDDEDSEIENNSTNPNESEITSKSNLEDSIIESSIKKAEDSKTNLEASVILSPLKLECPKKTDLSIINESVNSTNSTNFTNSTTKDNDSPKIQNSNSSSKNSENIPKNKKSGQYEKYVKQFKKNQTSEEDVEDAETVIFENSQTLKKFAQNVLNEKSTENNSQTMAVNNNNNNNSEINRKESLNGLRDSIRITQRRKNYQNWGLQLSNISENESGHSDEIEIVNTNEDVEKIIDSSMNSSLNENLPEQQLFLKPGNLQSCLKKQENGNVDSQRIERFTSIGSTSPLRVFKRISIRVVPDVNKFDIEDEDTQFLEAFGIPSSQTVSQKSLSLQENVNITASPEKNLENLEDSVLEAVDSQPVATAKCVVLEKCHQSDYLSFAQCYPNKFLKSCRKIGEGVYGEVFLHNENSESSVIKIIPIEGDDLVNGEPQKKFHEILSEIVIAKELHDLRFNDKYNTSSFVEVKNIKCIMGKYPTKLIEHWKTYDNEKKSENDCPSMFENDQLYISLELGNGGQDLEAFVFQNANECYSIFIQAAIALAVAERSLEFEHRDLHWGNLLISRTKKSQISYKLGNLDINLPTNGLKVAIIDFTLSRMSYKGCCIFNDLALDPALFTAEGEYQFEIYRLMRDKLSNDWQTFEPYTNILWLHYTIDKMITSVRYDKKKMTTKIHKNGIEKLKNLKKEILSYGSAYDLVTECDKFTVLYKDLNYSTDDDNNK
ncbi:hybrid signal transduction histidine kinase M isoform X2 [Leptopilina heterotoma]|uniref:hybrid signal transduction histidine kinase M isoform X2 n=1 Tax=Leptopilina heterotoma TaxID=63436 RepID=UPI001CA9F525|nr:hybrid signal transduction histidine kinase M isoform X2 [Leptopilina heterotoma]